MVLTDRGQGRWGGHVTPSPGICETVSLNSMLNQDGSSLNPTPNPCRLQLLGTHSGQWPLGWQCWPSRLPDGSSEPSRNACLAFAPIRNPGPGPFSWDPWKPERVEDVVLRAFQRDHLFRGHAALKCPGA